jgi:hypothetical protein
MDAIAIAIVVGTAILAISLVIVLSRQGHPEDAGPPPGQTDGGPTGEAYPPGSRPAGPGAEGMSVPDPGDVSPGEPPFRTGR